MYRDPKTLNIFSSSNEFLFRHLPTLLLSIRRKECLALWDRYEKEAADLMETIK